MVNQKRKVERQLSNNKTEYVHKYASSTISITREVLVASNTYNFKSLEISNNRAPRETNTKHAISDLKQSKSTLVNFYCSKFDFYYSRVDFFT